MHTIPNSLKILSLTVLVVVAASGCKSSKKAREAAAEKARQEQEAKLKQQQEDDRRKQAAADEQARRDAAARQQQQPEPSSYDKVNQYFNAIANSSDVTSANSSIAEALSLFASPNTPVLIVISGSGDQKDYDKPTTIKSYLNYLKDQKKNINKVENLETDSSGKITSVELRKN